jgi:cyclic beta-1,2-glucan synthetase
MTEKTNIEVLGGEPELPVLSLSGNDDLELLALGTHASELAKGLVWLPNTQSSDYFLKQSRQLARAIRPVMRKIQEPRGQTSSDDFRWLQDNFRLLANELEGLGEGFQQFLRLPHVRTPEGVSLPRVAAVAGGYLAAVGYKFSEKTFVAYVEAFQKTTVLKMTELWAVVQSLKLTVLQELARRASRCLSEPSGSYDIGTCVTTLRDVTQVPWRVTLEPLILFDHVLRQDPTGAYAKMDFDSREFYRKKLVKMAARSDFPEMEVARQALARAQEAQQQSEPDPRVAARRSHIGYYLIAEGADLLNGHIGFRPTPGGRVRAFLRKHPDQFYLTGIEILMFVIVLAVLLPLISLNTSLGLLFFSLLALLLPCSQGAIQVMNYLTTSLLPAQIIPKLDFSDGVPDDCVTLVAIPTLLLNEKQVRTLVDDLEVRFLGNHDRNLHFALVSDLPDSREPAREDDPLIDLCADLIRGLNEKYADQNAGSFLLLHRHRVYNPREGAWMGWERKRGKLLDLNKLLRQHYDSFPVKIGELSILPRVRFVLTLDSDTELPRRSAHRMIGAMAHPLNQAIIDPEKNLVVAGYGILQPRVGVSVQSASQSRLASIYSGETGFDIYTRAISDVYQDLYGEGIFTGKGIYEVDTLYQVLDRRFPNNILLSHDLIEGAYARAALASDIEIIEDYPSHYSAYSRRKHRWLRGDWQITAWLRSKVRDESGKYVANPISIVSQWKILDNLRRSLVEPATFLLLVCGWLFLPATPLYWTLVTVGILFLPVWCNFIFTLVRSLLERKMEIARDAWNSLFTANVNVFLSIVFLAHQTLISLDAVVRTLVRRAFTQRRLLEWETAAQAELGKKRTPLDIYLNWVPALALLVGLIVFLVNPAALPVAAPILCLWACNKLISVWLDQPSHPLRNGVSDADKFFLRRSALRTWRYFAEFSTQEHNWLIPDNVQERPPAVAARVSPTNIGLLLNTRQVACEFGYLTLPEFTEQTLRTLATIAGLTRDHGHLLNWYNTQTLEPLGPRFVSSVDSGNLVASLWTLEQGCLERLSKPILDSSLSDGFMEHLQTLIDLQAFPKKRFAQLRRELRKENWLQRLLSLADSMFAEVDDKNSRNATDVTWYREQALDRVKHVKETVSRYTPWLLPEFASLRDDPAIKLNSTPESISLERLPDFIETLSKRLDVATRSTTSINQGSLYTGLQSLLPEARSHSQNLIRDLQAIATAAGRTANEMDFEFLLNPYRRLLSIGFNVDTQKVEPACYDLLASESRTAAFVAIAKDDVPQEAWFMLGRTHTLDHGHPVLLSWSGTMFEYLMPALWMRTHPNTLLERTVAAAVRAQQAYAEEEGIPWGISESAFFKMDDAGNYQYHAFGLPSLALRRAEGKALVVSPYSTFLALHIDPEQALENLRKMDRDGWFGAYGFYESADFSAPQRTWRHRYELVPCWMAHHQGMSLLAIANFLRDNVVQQWFHRDRRVQATELLLHEKPVTHVRHLRRRFRVAA